MSSLTPNDGEVCMVPREEIEYGEDDLSDDDRSGDEDGLSDDDFSEDDNDLKLFGDHGQRIVWDADANDSFRSQECQRQLYKLLDPFFPDVLKDLIYEYASDYRWQCPRCQGVWYFTCRKASEIFFENHCGWALTEMLDEDISEYGQDPAERGRFGNSCEGLCVTAADVFMADVCPRGCPWRLSEATMEVTMRAPFVFNRDDPRWFQLEQICWQDTHVVPKAPGCLILAGERKW